MVKISSVDLALIAVESGCNGHKATQGVGTDILPVAGLDTNRLVQAR